MKCPYCGKGPRVENTYETKDGITRDDGYCGNCGRNWPAPKVKR